MTLSELFSEIIQKCLEKNCKINSYSNLSGGCIHRVYKLTTNLGNFCIKVNSLERYNMFLTESQDLMMLRNAEVIKIPEVFGIGQLGDVSYILMEYITPGKRREDYWQKLGEELAFLHQKSTTYFGLEYNNYIGALPQINEKKTDWIEFYIYNRLEVQLKLGLNSGKIDKHFARKLASLYPKLKSILFVGAPSLLHGDLWSGNVIMTENGSSALIDPSVYFGNREIEIAFTTLFGGFENEFYNAYQYAFPMEQGFDERKDIYLIYPLLVHYNLFGGGYIREADAIIDKYI